MACATYQRLRCREKSVRGKAGGSPVSSSGVCGEEQLGGLTVPELRAMAKVRGAPASATCTHCTQVEHATLHHLQSALSTSMLHAWCFPVVLYIRQVMLRP